MHRPARCEIGKPRHPRILLAQLPHPAYASRNVPLAAGYLVAACQARGLTREAEITILDPALMNHAGDRLLRDRVVAEAPDILGLTLHLWNIEPSLLLIREVKEALPGCMIVVGGPEVTPHAGLLDTASGIDVCVHGEGEETFAELVEAFVSGSQDALDRLPGLSYRRGSESHYNGPRGRLVDPGVVPSPYLLGLVQVAPYREMLLTTMRGCPFGCSYCSWTSRGRLRPYPLERLREELLLARQVHTGCVVSIIDSAFNLSPVFEPLCETAAELNRDRRLVFHGFAMAGRIGPAEAQLLRAANFQSVEVGLQSIHADVLGAVNRRVDLGEFARGIECLRAAGIQVLPDVILGLPGDTPDGFSATIRYLESLDLNPIVFNLSLGHASALRGQAHRHGMRWQEKPPFYVTEQTSFGREALLAAVKSNLTRLADFNKVTNLGLPALPHLGPPSTCAEARPISRILLRGEASADATEIEKVAANLSNQVTLHVVADRLDDAEPFLARLLPTCSTVNPHSCWTILLDLASGDPADSDADRIASYLTSSNAFLPRRGELLPREVPYVLYGSSSVFFCVEGTRTPAGLHASRLLRRLTITADQAPGPSTERALRAPCAGFIVRILDGVDMRAVRELMDHLERQQVSDGSFFFEDAVLQRIWEQEHTGITSSLFDHGEAAFGPAGESRIGPFEERDLWWEALCHWGLFRDGVDAESLMAAIEERVARTLEPAAQPVMR